MLSEKMEAALNGQLKHEAQASFNYLAMASWAEGNRLDGAAEFFMEHAAEENSHFLKIFQYINETGGKAIVPAVDQPEHSFGSILEACKKALEHEQHVTRNVSQLVEIAVDEKDHATYDFLRFFVDEQREEEVLFNKVLDRIELIGSGPQALYYIDKELSKIRSGIEE